MKRAVAVFGVAAALWTVAAPAWAGDIAAKHRACEWAGRHLTTGFPSYDRLLASRDPDFWGNRTSVMVSVPLGEDENGVWHEAVYAICPPAGYHPPSPSH